MLVKHQHLIVTRPKGQAEKLIPLLNQSLKKLRRDATISHLPLLTISPLPIEPERLANSHNFKRFNGIIFISPNAVKYAVSQLSSSDWSLLTKQPLYAVGSQTQQSLMDATHNKNIIVPEQMNSEGLLSLSELSQVKGQNWLIVKGQAGREFLKQTLNERGAKVEELSTYQRMPPNEMHIQKILKHTRTNALWLITSLQAVINLKNIIDASTMVDTSNSEASIRNCSLIVSSDRIKYAALKMGFDVIAIANGASDQQLNNCIRELKL